MSIVVHDTLRRLTFVRQLMNPSETTCPASVAVIEALWPAYEGSSATWHLGSVRGS